MPVNHWLLTLVMPSVLLAPLSPPATTVATGAAGGEVNTVKLSAVEGIDALPAISVTCVVTLWALPVNTALRLQRPAASAVNVCNKLPLSYTLTLAPASVSPPINGVAVLANTKPCASLAYWLVNWKAGVLRSACASTVQLRLAESCELTPATT